MAAKVFWLDKKLSQMTPKEWESLCDGCGKCCLHKLEDEDNGDVYYTKVACRYLDLQTCQCTDYSNRLSLVPECVKLDVHSLSQVYWLPVTCAYRILAEGNPLPDWHPLVSGSKKTVESAGISVKEFAVSECDIPIDDYETQIINWVV